MSQTAGFSPFDMALATVQFTVNEDGSMKSVVTADRLNQEVYVISHSLVELDRRVEKDKSLGYLLPQREELKMFLNTEFYPVSRSNYLNQLSVELNKLMKDEGFGGIKLLLESHHKSRRTLQNSIRLMKESNYEEFRKYVVSMREPELLRLEEIGPDLQEFHSSLCDQIDDIYNAHKLHGNHALVLTKDEAVSALATYLGDSDLILLSAGAISQPFRWALHILSISECWPHFSAQGFPSTISPSHDLKFTEWEELAVPQDAARQAIANEITNHTIEYIVLHELGHIFYRNNRDSAESSGSTIHNTDGSLTDNTVKTYVDELKSDEFALRHMLSRNINTRFGFLPDNSFFWKFFGDQAESIYTRMFASLFLIRMSAEVEVEVKPNHPSGKIRLMSLLKTNEEYFINVLKISKFNAHLSVFTVYTDVDRAVRAAMNLSDGTIWESLGLDGDTPEAGEVFKQIDDWVAKQ